MKIEIEKFNKDDTEEAILQKLILTADLLLFVAGDLIKLAKFKLKKDAEVEF